MSFELFLFSTDPATITEAAAGGVAGFIVDWEYFGKHRRQAGFDTQINADTVVDLERVRAATERTVICRINAPDDRDRCRRELDAAGAAGADEVLLPMVSAVVDVECALEHCDRNGGPRIGILIETLAAVELAPALGELPLARIYVGLNDLAIDRGMANIFESLIDGTLEAMRPHIRVPFGVAGLTLPHLGSPIPCRLLMAQLARLRCDFTFLRRSFLADGAECGYTEAARRTLEAMADQRARPAAALQADVEALRRSVHAAPDPRTWRFRPKEVY